MITLVITTLNMHKIADFTVNVKYRHPGNVVAYLPVEFEIFFDEENYKAVPVITFQNKILTDLPNELMFQVKDGKICNYKAAEKEIVQDLLNKIVEMTAVKRPQRKFGDTTSISW